MEEALDNAKLKMEEYYEIGKNKKYREGELTAKEYFEWIHTKTEHMIQKEKFELSDNVRIKRGEVFWVNFGYNIGDEFSGRHPAIVLKSSRTMCVVLPLSSKEPTELQKQKGNYVEINKVYNFKAIKR